MKILIVGAGPSGLAALKEMQEAGFDAVAVDTRPTFGGVFAPDSGVTFEGLHLTISSLFMSYSDFPAPDADKGVNFWSKQEYFEYIASYVAHFGLARHMRLGTRVDRAHFDHDRGTWRVRMTTLSSDAHRQVDETFDKLIVASGANHRPSVPDTLKAFGGELLHSSAFHSPEQVKGKRVLVIGTGEGSVDVASSAAKTAAEVTVWGRRFPDVAPRFTGAFLHDSDYDEQRYLSKHHKPNEVLEHIAISQAVRNLPLGLWSIGMHGLMGHVRKKHGPDSMQGMTHAMASRAWQADYFSSDTSMVPTKSGVLLTAAAQGLLDLVIAPTASVDGSSLAFSGAQVFGKGGDGAAATPSAVDRLRREFDVIVSCTGFRLDVDWITTSDPEFALTRNPRTWFKHCFPPGMGKHLAMIGFARPHSGGISQCSEMLSRYIAQLHLGNRTLPTDYAALAIAEGEAEAACFNVSPEYHMLVDYMAFMVSVAKLVGCEPRALPPLHRPLDAVKYWTFPLWPCFFRTQGVGARPEAAEAVLSHFGPFDAIAPTPLIAAELVCAFIMPFVNFASLVADTVAPGITRRALSRGYRWRLSKKHFLYHNSLTLRDFKAVPTQWLAATLVTLHLLTGGLRPRTTAHEEENRGIKIPA